MPKRLIRPLALLLVVLIICGCLGSCSFGAVKVSLMKDGASLALVHLIDENEKFFDDLDANYKFTYNNTTNSAAQVFIDGDADIAVVSADKAALLATNNSEIVCLAYCSYANYSIFGNIEEDLSIEQIIGNSVYINGRSTSAEIILRHIYDSKNISAGVNTSIRYTSSNKELREVLKVNNSSEFVLLSQPFASSIMLDTAAREVIDVAEEFKEVEPDIPLIGSCVIARRKYVKRNKDKVEEFLREYKDSIERCKLDNDSASKLGEEFGIAGSDIIASLILYDTDLELVTGEQMKKDMTAYYEFIGGKNILTIGKVPTDDFYYTVE